MLKIESGNKEGLDGNEDIVTSKKRIVVIGKSGAGKSTFLKSLYSQPDRIKIEDKQLMLKDVGFLPQDNFLFPNWSVVQNIAMPQYILLGIDMNRAEKIARLSLEKLGLDFNKPLEALSGGERQRVCICRTLVLKPQILLLDEPTSSLDPLNTKSFGNLLKTTLGKFPMIITTHNINFAKEVGEYFIFFDNLKIEEKGEDLLKNPSSKLKDFLSGFQ